MRTASKKEFVDWFAGAGKAGEKMGPFDYVVVKLYGDYADLKRTDIASDELLMIARALLPDEVEEGTKLHYEMFEYTIIC